MKVRWGCTSTVAACGAFRPRTPPGSRGTTSAAAPWTTASATPRTPPSAAARATACSWWKARAAPSRAFRRLSPSSSPARSRRTTATSGTATTATGSSPKGVRQGDGEAALEGQGLEPYGTVPRTAETTSLMGRFFENFALYNAPPETQQRMAVYLLRQPARGGADARRGARVHARRYLQAGPRLQDLRESLPYPVRRPPAGVRLARHADPGRAGAHSPPRKRSPTARRNADLLIISGSWSARFGTGSKRVRPRDPRQAVALERGLVNTHARLIVYY